MKGLMFYFLSNVSIFYRYLIDHLISYRDGLIHDSKQLLFNNAFQNVCRFRDIRGQRLIVLAPKIPNYVTFDLNNCIQYPQRYFLQIYPILSCVNLILSCVYAVLSMYQWLYGKNQRCSRSGFRFVKQIILRNRSYVNMALNSRGWRMSEKIRTGIVQYLLMHFSVD